MKRRALLILILPIVIAGVAYSIQSGLIYRCWMVITGTPKADFPRVVDVGDRENGDVVDAQFTIENSGGGVLNVGNFSSSCQCLEFGQENEGKLEKPDLLQVGSGERVSMLARLAVRGEIGKQASAFIRFETSDPSRPEASVRIVVPRILAGILVSPAQVHFANSTIGDQCTQILEVHDVAERDSYIERVISSNPEKVTVRMLPQNSLRSKDGHPTLELLGRIEVGLKTENAGRVDEQVEIHLNDRRRQPKAVSVSAKVLESVTVNPRSLILPRASSTGNLFHGECICRNTRGTPLSLVIEEVPVDMVVTMSEIQDDKSTQLVQIEWNPGRNAAAEDLRTRIIRLRARCGSNEFPVAIPVHCRLPGDTQ